MIELALWVAAFLFLAFVALISIAVLSRKENPYCRMTHDQILEAHMKKYAQATRKSFPSSS